MSLTWLIPPLSIFKICLGILVLFIKDCNAGIRLSKTKVVLPDPDTPVITVNLPLGISTFSGLTV